MLSEEKINKIKELSQLSYTQKEIAKIVDCSIPTVKKYSEQKIDYMIGKTFGRLKVIERAERDVTLKNRCIRYKCQCECGNIVIVNGNSLRTNHTISCGCSRKNINIKDISGQRFGHLVAIELVSNKIQGRARWKCLCDCGNVTYVNSHELIQGDTISCGCQKRSYGEEKITKLLLQLNLKFLTEYKINNCKDKRPLPFDFALFNENNDLVCLIEYQGEQHYKSTGGWNNEEKLLYNKNHDKIKFDYCQQNNIPLIIIPFWDINKLDIEYMKGQLNRIGLSINN